MESREGHAWGTVLRPQQPGTDGARTRGAAIGAGLTWMAAWGLRIALIAVGFVVLGYVIGMFWSVVWPVVLAILLTTVLRPPAGWLIRHRLPPALASAVALLVAVGVVTGIFVAIAPSVVGQGQQIANGVVAGIGQIRGWLAGPPFNLGEGELGGLLDTATRQVQQSATTIAGGVLTGVSAFASGLLNVVLALVLSFFFIKDGPRFLPWLTAISGPSVGRHLSAVLSRMWAVLGGFIRVQAMVSLIDAVLIGIGLVVMSVPLALPLAVLTFLGGFIPIIGALVAGALAVLIALVTQGLTTAIVVLVIIVAVQQLEGNVLQPLLQGQSLRLHGAVVLLGVTAGGSMGGIGGAFLAVPVVAVVAVLLRYTGEQIDRNDPRNDGAVPPADDDGSGRSEQDGAGTGTGKGTETETGAESTSAAATAVVASEDDRAPDADARGGHA